MNENVADLMLAHATIFTEAGPHLRSLLGNNAAEPTVTPVVASQVATAAAAETDSTASPAGAVESVLRAGVSAGNVGRIPAWPRRESAATVAAPSTPANVQPEQTLRALSHDLSASLMMLEASLKRLRGGQEPAARPHDSTWEQVTACLADSRRYARDLAQLVKQGRIEMAAQRVDVSAVVRDVLIQQRELLAERGVRVQVAGRLPEVLCHPQRLHQVLTNLVRNAARHGAPAHDGVPARQEARSRRQAAEQGATAPQRPAATEPCIQIVALTGSEAPATDVSTNASDRSLQWIAVRDNGPGIPVESREAVFAVGCRLAGADPEGTGMGLAIVRQFVEYYGGRVVAREAPGGGAELAFGLPAASG